MLSEEQIEYGRENVKYSLEEGGHHEHDDCIRMAYEWLDAQKKTKQPTTTNYPIKHMIETWAGRYVSRTDVEVAAFLHQEIQGAYPQFNISSRLTKPSDSRLNNIAEAFLHPEIQGTYPQFNISSRLTRPSDSRLNDIAEAFTQAYRDRFDPSIYSAHEQTDE